ncbi:MAG TPA: hypothetical protein ENI76_11020 [Ignavibacteria bacterium]|nr:hypothetical protein [Ignavibacteria bacterium]
MNYQELIREVELNIQDASQELIDSIPSRINRAIEFIAGEILFPDLLKLGSVTTIVGQATLTMPADFEGKLLFCGRDKGQINIKPGVDDIMELDSNFEDVGDVMAVAVMGSTMYYWKSPATATILPILYYKTVTPLVASSDVPSFIPTGDMQEKLIVSKVTMDIFDKIEQGFEGDKVNYLSYKIKLREAIIEARVWIVKRNKNMVKYSTMWSS